LCDHQNPMMRGGSCGCLYFNRYWIWRSHSQCQHPQWVPQPILRASL
jgi:hypothetical protein